MTTLTEPSSFSVFTASLRTGMASGRMFDLLKSKWTLRRTIFRFTGGAGGGAWAIGGGGGGASGAVRKSYFNPIPPVAQRMSDGPCSPGDCPVRVVGRADM